MRSSAVISENRVHRYELRREWDARLPPLVAIMLNPSLADERLNDPTVSRLIYRAAHGGFGSLIIGNIGAGRNTNPRAWAKMDDPIGPSNKRYLKNMLLEARDRKGKVMAGWGAHAPVNLARDVVELARRIGVKLFCLGVTINGAPLHPLRVAYAVPLRRF